jgi:hypothetical protein
MKILCINDIICRDNQTGELDKEKSFLKGKIYETYPFRGKTQLYANDDTGSMHCLGWLDENGTLKDDDGWFEEYFKVIFR